MKRNDSAKAPLPVLDWLRLERAIRHDPGRRGLASYADRDGRPLLVGALRAAAEDLVAHGRRVAVVTGFAVRREAPGASPIAETDGPPGSIYLAAMLHACGIDSLLVTDVVAEPVLRAGLEWIAPATIPLLVAPPLSNDAAGREAVRDWWAATHDEGAEMSHVVAVERVGPSHTAASIEAEARDEWVSKSSEYAPDACYNMRGLSLDDCTAPLHVLFENVETAASVHPYTIGIVDGGNEIGCGNVPWRVLREAVSQGAGDRIACRIRTAQTILAGVSNWGAYALGAAVAVLRGRRAAVEAWTADKQRLLIEALVRDGGAVDGCTKRREPTVDGLPLDEYLAVFNQIREIALG